MKKTALALTAVGALLGGCAVGPDYRRPDVDVGAGYKESGDWVPSRPRDGLNRGPWWTIYGDPVLDELESRVEISNQNVKAAAAAVEQARALVREAEAGFWPTLTATAGRQRSNNAPNRGARTVNSAGLGASWDLDVWGRIRRETESSSASAEASLAALAAARLAAQAELASDYFALRAQDQLQSLLNDTVNAQRRSLQITESRYHFGVAAKADVAGAQAQLLASQSQQVNAAIRRALLEHAVAVLIGRPPSKFSLSSAAMRADVPTVPAGLPSALLERRPDVAEAERKVAAANAQIGVARAAFFPSVNLSGSDDYSAGTLAKLFSASTRVWAFGPSLAETVFAGGLHRAEAAAARASFDISVAEYRQTVLAALQQVEDQLATLRILEKQAAIEDAAVAAAVEAQRLTLDQYKAGTVPYSSVITAQTATLTSRETALNVLLSRLTASVTMIEALGGGWHAAALN